MVDKDRGDRGSSTDSRSLSVLSNRAIRMPVYAYVYPAREDFSSVEE